MTTHDALSGPVDRIELADLIRVADFQTRQDRKYLVPRGNLTEVIAALPPARVLSIDGATSFPYDSVYFDTPELVSYRAAATRRPRRFKVRTRAYTASGQCMLEVKVRDTRGRTIKHRSPHPIEHRGVLTPDGEDFVRAIPQVSEHLALLRPALSTSYRRSTYMLDDHEARVTVDVDLCWWTSTGRRLDLPGVAIIETKSAGPPSGYDRALWRLGLRPSTVSKYCTGLAALHPGLPANKWHRVLTRDLAGQPGVGGPRIR